MTTERASERDREYFRRWGEWKAELRREDNASYLALSPKQRQERAETFVRRSLGYARTDRTGEEPRSLIARAKELGLYRA